MKTILQIAVMLALVSGAVASAQEAPRYTKVANRLVELINAADYSGVESLFNKDMSAALPLDKATEFLKGLNTQIGKIQTLDQPEPSFEGWLSQRIASGACWT